MQFFRSTIFTCLVSFVGGVACTSLVAWYGFAHYNQPKLDDSSVKLLRERLSELGPLSLRQQKVLADEMRRVSRYERKLRKRADTLDALLSDTLELDRSIDAPLLDDISTGSKDDGIGGAVEHVAPLLVSPRQTAAVAKGEKKTTVDAAAKRAIFEYPIDILQRLDYQTSLLSNVPIGAPSRGRLSSSFGKRRSPFSRRWHMHKGLDFALDRKSPITATADGVVEKAGYMRGYGLVVVVNHQNGFETVYGHMSKIKVTVGQKVCRGERIGLVGSTGRSTGPHVHYEIRLDDKPIDPMPFVKLITFLRFV